MRKIVAPRFRTLVSVPISRGSVNLPTFFPGKTLKVDSLFQEFLSMTVGVQYVSPQFNAFLYQTRVGGNNDEVMMRTFNINGTLDGNSACAILKHLGGVGSPILEVHPGENERNIVLGYMLLRSSAYVLYVEHELEHGVDEVHLHAQSLNRWDRKTPMILV